VRRFGLVPFLAAAAFLTAVAFLGAAFLAAGFGLGLLAALAGLPVLRAERVLLALARVALRPAVFADFETVFRPLVRLLARAVVRAAFLVPPAALRLAIACSFFGPSRSRRLP
jgi:hypothetical protein